MITDDAQPFRRGWFDRVEDLFAGLAQWALIVLLALVIFQIVARYALSEPVGEVVTVTETYLMPAIVFFTIAALQRNDGHVRVDLLYVNLRGRARQIADLLILVLSALFWSVVVYASAGETLFSFRMGYEVSKNFPVPLGSAIGLVPVGGTLILIRLVLQAAATARALGRPVPTDRTEP